ncbi:MAG: ABC transporter permease [bacterium]
MRLGIRRRPDVKAWVDLSISLLSVIVALALGAFLLASAGVDPIRAYRVMILGSFGSFYNFSEVLVRATPLILCGLAVGFAAKMLLWNVGGEGQLVMGGIAAAGVALFLSKFIPSSMILPAMIVAGFLGGALWAMIPAVLKAVVGVSEILTSLMLNYVAIFWLEHLFYGPWRDPAGRGFPGTAMFSDVARLPRFFGTRVHLGLAFALLAALFIYLILSYSRWGYEIRVIGESQEAARYAGMNIPKNIILVMSLSGALAGVAGMAETAGIHYRLQQGLAAGYGYAGIIVAFLGRLNPPNIVAIGILLGALFVGGDQLQIASQVPSSISLVLESAILFCVLAGEIAARYRIVLVRDRREGYGR